MIITLLIHQYITQIQENTIKKQTQGKSTSQQQMVPLLVIMQRSKVFAYSQCHHKKRKTRRHLELTSVRNEKSNGWGKASREADRLCKLLWDSTKGLPPGKAQLVSKQVLSVMPSYPIMCLWYVWCSLTLLMDALWYHQDRRDTQLSRLLASIFHCSMEGEHLNGQGKWERKITQAFTQTPCHEIWMNKWVLPGRWN